MYISPEKGKIIEQYREFVGRHLVTMSWFQQKLTSTNQKLGQARPISISGFAMSFGEDWCLITAGHILEELDSILNEGTEVMQSCSLSATMGDGLTTTNMTPFNYSISRRHAWAPADASVDCGAILLDSACREYLESKEVRPLKAEKATNSAMHNFEHLFSIGIPCNSLVERELDEVTEAWSSLMILPLVSTQVHDIRFPSDHFFATPKKPLTKDKLDGMSGSPIFGIKKCESGWHYGVCAIQTNFLPEHGAVVGCPSSVFVTLVQSWLTELQR